LLVEQDDPEQRVADLEHQLAERQRGADLPPASPDAAPTLGRFLASAAPGSSKRGLAFTFGMLAALMLLFVAVHAMVPRDTYSTAGIPICIGIWVIGGCVLYFGFPDLVGRARRRKIVICVTGDELTVNPRRGKVL
jgi:hypothetical protein